MDRLMPPLDGDLANDFFRNVMWADSSSTARKASRSITTGISPEMYEAMQVIITHPQLPYGGSMSALVRDAVAVRIESIKHFLDKDSVSIWNNLLRQQRRLTRERMVQTFDAVIASQMESLEFWTNQRNWALVVSGMVSFSNEIDSYGVNEWRQHCIQKLVSNPALARLLRSWQTLMKEDSPEEFNKVVGIVNRWYDTAE